MPRSPLNKPLLITQDFGAAGPNYGLTGHTGLDLRSRLSEDWFACVPGILHARTDWKLLPYPHLVGYGRAWELDWGQPDGTFIKFIYGHGMNRRLRLDRQHVDEGQFIAESGNTGMSTAAHLHFEMRHYLRVKGGQKYDPKLGLFYNLLNPRTAFFDHYKIPIRYV
jgi:hypothetical protein